jgi:hypothetical protein
MIRVVAAVFISPLLVSLLFGQFFIIAYLFMLLVSVGGALPLFLLLSKLKRLDWWHAVVSGSLFGLFYAYFNTSDLDNLLSQNNVVYIGLGAITGFVFWWIAVFRNPKFDFVSASFPVSSLLIVPIVGGLIFLNQFLRIENFRGRVLSISEINPYPIPSKKCTVSVRLSNGEKVSADFWGCDWPREDVVEKCFHLNERWSTLRFRFVYDISTRLGGNVNDC